MRPTTRATTLEYALLGILDQDAHSGYELRRLFADTPLQYFSDSPGAIYPALRRLVARRWVAASAPAGGRRRRTFRLSAQGRQALLAWLTQPVTAHAVVHDPDSLTLRFAFMGQAASIADMTAFLVGYEREMRAQLQVLRDYHDALARGWPLTGRLAFEHGLLLHETRLAWARTALRAVGKAKRGPHDRPRLARRPGPREKG